MQRRNQRERREFLFRKAQEAQTAASHQRKETVKAALLSGTSIPGQLREEAEDIRKQLAYDEHTSGLPDTHIDDEYASAGVEDPKILITTSRDPSSRLLMFSKEMRLVIPNSQRINRGGYVTKDIVDACKANQVTDLIILHETRGQPDAMVVCHFPYGPTAYFTLHNVVLRHDIPDTGTVSEQYPHLIFDNLTSKLGLRVASILKYLFPVPKPPAPTGRLATFANRGDFISFRHHVYRNASGNKKPDQVELMEVGPRFEMQAYQIKLGTLDVAADADIEWVYRPYQRTAKKRSFLS